jgi:agmatine/peptidylarginine deiminase
MNKLIIAPIFNIDKDVLVLDKLQECFPKSEIHAIDCSALSMEGGLVNCITMNYKL